MAEGKVVLTRHMPPPAEELLWHAGFEVDELEFDDAPPREEILARIAGASGVITMLSDRVDDEFLEAAGSDLKVVANYAVGFDNIDLDACKQRGVRVSNTPDVLTEATADLTWALILAAARLVPEGDRFVRSGMWQGWAPTQMLGLELCGATLGIVGAGRIGCAVARRAIGFGMQLLYVSNSRNTDLEQATGATRVDLDVLVEEADVVSLHIPMRPENHQLIDYDRLSRMKSHALLINTARGSVVDEQALVSALQTRRIGGAGLDVYENEPALAPGLAELPNVVLLPHLGSATTATRQKMGQIAAENVIAVLQGGKPLNPVG